MVEIEGPVDIEKILFQFGAGDSDNLSQSWCLGPQMDLKLGWRFRGGDIHALCG
jgi:hypothetical protein